MQCRFLQVALKQESCELVGLPATSIKQQATESKGESNVIKYLKKHRENWYYSSVVVYPCLGPISLTRVYGIHWGISQAQAGAGSKHKAYRASWPADYLEGLGLP